MNAYSPLMTACDADRLEVVTSPERLAAVAPAWEELWRRADGLVFQHPSWIQAWWATDPRQDRRQLRIGLLWRGATLEAVLPFAIIERKGLRILEWAAKDHSDYGDCLASAEVTQAMLAGLWKGVVASGGFDMVYLNRLLPDAAAQALVTPPGKPALILRPNHRSEISYRVAGPWTKGAQWFESQSKKTRQNYRRGRKVLEEAGELRFRLLGDDEPLEPLLERVAALKRKWLERNERASDLFDEGAPALAALVGTMAKLGILRIFVLECAGRPIAISINFVQRGTMMAFVTTYDPDFERASPGTVLMMDYIQWSIDRGLVMVDFLCGGEDFKRRFATQSQPLESVIGSRTALGALAVAADGLTHRARSLHAKHGARWKRNRTAAVQRPDAED
jgi:CelD/BcsL family acetyltransferase involved in cellulose biosynthesis